MIDYLIDYLPLITLAGFYILLGIIYLKSQKDYGTKMAVILAFLLLTMIFTTIWWMMYAAKTLSSLN